jgi:hypothetical protein
MEIIYRGTPKKERTWLGYCRQCNSSAIAKENELINITNDQRDGEFSWETCPVCGAGGDNGWGGMLFRPRLDVSWSKE